MNCYGTGRLTADPELREVNGTAVCNFTIATNEFRKIKDSTEKQEIVNFLECVVWDSAAKFLVDNAKKGTKVFINGRLRQERWEKDGKKMSKVVIRVENFEIFPAYQPKE